MKTYRNLMVVALGLVFAFSVVGANAGGMMCGKCKAPIPASTKPVVVMLSADSKCAECGMTLKAGNVSQVTCPTCKAVNNVCDKCAKMMAAASKAPASV